MHEINTSRLYLRQFRDDDLEDLYSLLGTADVGRMLPKGEAYTREEAEQWLTGFSHHWRDRNFGAWAVEARSNRRFLGYCGLRFFPEYEEVEVLYSIAKEHWGNGFASEAATASVEFGLHELRLQKIIGLTKMDNPASSAVLLRAGLHFVKNTEIFGFPCRYYEIK